MMTVEDQGLNISSSYRWLDRALWIVGALLLIVVVGFGVFYFRDRYVHANEPLVQRQINRLEDMVRENPENPTVRVSVAGWYLQEGLLDRAIQQAQEALELSPDYLEALIVLGQAHMANGEHEQAIADFARIVELTKDSEFTHVDPRMNLVYYDLGELYRQRGEYDNAIEALKGALLVDRTDADARYALALTYQAQGDHQAAIQEFSEAVRFVPDFVEAYQGLQVSYSALGQANEALYAEGMVAYSQGDYERAAQQLEAVIEAAPEFDPAYLGLGMTYVKLGEREKATANLNKYLEVNPGNYAAEHSLGRLSEMEEQ